MMNQAKKSMSDRALICRINRKLAHNLERLIKLRINSRDYSQHGPYFIEDMNTRGVQSYGISDLQELAKQLGV